MKHINPLLLSWSIAVCYYAAPVLGQDLHEFEGIGLPDPRDYQDEQAPPQQPPRKEFPFSQPWHNADPLIQGVEPGSPAEWFKSFDRLCCRALPPQSETDRANTLLNDLGPITTDDQDFLRHIIDRYQYVSEQLQQNPSLNETDRLQRGTYEYVCECRDLFSDYLRWQTLPAETRQSTAQQVNNAIAEHRRKIGRLESNNERLDKFLRNSMGIRPLPPPGNKVGTNSDQTEAVQ